ncbi:Conserved_hypothetical protein [Hexamita inflata]|uniref:Uncharacterized protein n=1 Tax=Hexamita inflata TaxID=28002 RepID=A0ABP1HFL4_9EUKA
MQIVISNTRVQQIQIPNALSFIFAAKFGSEYKLISPNKINIEDLPNCVSTQSEGQCILQADLPVSQVINMDLQIDLIGVYSLNPKSPNELVAIPLQTQIVDFYQLLLQTASTDIKLKYNVGGDYLSTQYPGIYSDSLQIEPIEAIFTVDIVNRPVLQGRQADMVLTLSACQEMQIDDHCWQAELSIGDHAYIYDSGYIEQNMALHLSQAQQNAFLNDLTQPIKPKPSSFTVKFPTRSEFSVGPKPFQAQVQSYLSEFQQKIQEPTDKKKKSTFKFVQEAFEAFCVTQHKSRLQNPTKILLAENSTPNITIKLKLSQKNYNAEKQEKSAQKSQFGTVFGVLRSNFAEPKEIDLKNYQFNSSGKINGSQTHLLQVDVNGVFYPFDGYLHGESSELKKNTKLSPMDYPDQVNRINSNAVIGIQSIQNKLERIQLKTQQNGIGQKQIMPLLEVYQKNMKSIEHVNQLYNKLHKLCAFTQVYTYNQEQISFPEFYLMLKFEFPLGLKHITPQAPEEINLVADFKLVNGVVEPDEKPSNIMHMVEQTKSFLNKIGDKIFLEQKPQSRNDPQRSVAQQRLQQKQFIQKTFALRGLSGKIQSRQLTLPKMIARQSSLDIKQFTETILGEGLVGQFIDIITAEMAELGANGYSNPTEFANQLLNVNERVLTKLKYEQNVTGKNGISPQRAFSHKNESPKINQVLRNISKAKMNQSIEFQQSPEQRRIAKFIKQNYFQVFQLTATNTDRYLKAAQRQFYAIVQRYSETQKPENLVKFLQAAGIQGIFSDLLSMQLFTHLWDEARLTNLTQI